MDSERIVAMPGPPMTAASIGRVMICSTCSGASPGASVWIVTCGGTNSGNTSSGACIARKTPAKSQTTESSATKPR